VERPVLLESEAERFTAFDATTSFVCAAAARRPIVIVLDDLQAADVATVRLLEFLAGRIHRARILAIGTSRPITARPDSELTLALADLGKVAQRLLLRGLSRQVEQVNLDLLAERLGRVEDLELVVDLISTGMAALRQDIATLAAMVEQVGGGVDGVIEKLDQPLQVTVERPHRSGVRDLFQPTSDDPPEAS